MFLWKTHYTIEEVTSLKIILFSFVIAQSSFLRAKQLSVVQHRFLKIFSGGQSGKCVKILISKVNVHSYHFTFSNNIEPIFALEHNSEITLKNTSLKKHCVLISCTSIARWVNPMSVI